MPSNTIILYHANCLDGTGAKYAAWKKFGDEASYIPVQYGSPVPEEVMNSTGKNVFVLDFSFSREVLLELRTRHFVMVIDHHKTAAADIADLAGCIFDMSKSGAVLAWEYFHPGVPVPDTLLHVQDRDLWQWKMFNTKEITAGLTELEGDMKEWDTTRTHKAFESGSAVCKYIDRSVDSATKDGRVVFVPLAKFGLGKVGIVNATNNVSEICQAIYTKYPDVDAAISYFIDPKGCVILSFRSDNKKADSVDVSAIAKTFDNGGGHKTAAGGRTTLLVLQQIINGEY